MLVIYLVLAIGVSFLCSLFEAVILSLTPAYASTLVRQKKPGAKIVSKVKERIDDALSAILTINTISHTVGAAGVGAEVQRLYGDEWVALGSAILTLLILALSEIVPKTIGATYWQALAVPVAYGIRGLVIISYPLVLVFRWLSGFISSGNLHQKTVSREELHFVADVGAKEGIFSEEESKILKNLAQMRKLEVEDILTPRTVVLALPKEMTAAEVMDKYQMLPFSRIPVYEDRIDTILGKVHKYAIIEAVNEGRGDASLEELVNPVIAVGPHTSVTDVLKLFIDNQAHMFTVFDEHGGFTGVVTLEDAIETLLGAEIIDEYDSVEDLRKHARNKWEERHRQRTRHFNVKE